jgi:hypothetical protein
MRRYSISRGRPTVIEDAIIGVENYEVPNGRDNVHKAGGRRDGGGMAKKLRPISQRETHVLFTRHCNPLVDTILH